ncbi:MAG: hypothetical protein JSW35_11970 [Deltaproteobacteria bacterium]|nr:MAG: hypothetical protein JSW35_11970 [Deltaproteobacteria bacterium]
MKEIQPSRMVNMENPHSVFDEVRYGFSACVDVLKSMARRYPDEKITSSKYIN